MDVKAFDSAAGAFKLSAKADGDGIVIGDGKRSLLKVRKDGKFVALIDNKKTMTKAGQVLHPSDDGECLAENAATCARDLATR